MYEVRTQKLEREFDHFKRVVLQRFDHINQSNSELLNTLRSMKLDSPSRIVIRLESPSSYGDASRKRQRVVDTNKGCPDPDSIAIEASPEKSTEVASNRYTRTTTQEYTAIACSDDFLTFNLKALSSWMDPNKSQKHIRSIVTRIATFYLSLATTEEVEILESVKPGIENDANASESWKFVSRIKSKTRRIFSRLLLYQKNSATASAHWTSGWGISSGNRRRHKCTVIGIH